MSGIRFKTRMLCIVVIFLCSPQVLFKYFFPCDIPWVDLYYLKQIT